MAYRTDGTWNPEGGSTEKRLQGLLATTSPLMKQAAAQGTRAAGRRGLLNSSIAVGASQDAMIKNALPIAAQDAAADAQRDLSAQGAAQSSILQREGVQGTKEINREQQAVNMEMQNRQIGSTEKLTFAQLESAERQSTAEIAARERMLGRQLDAEETNQIRQQNVNKEMQATELGSIEGRQARELGSIEGRQARELTSLEGRATQESALRERMNTATLQSQETIQRWNISSRDREAAMSAQIGMINSYTQSIQSLLENPNIPADVRERYETHFMTMLATNQNLVRSIYGTAVTWN